MFAKIIHEENQSYGRKNFSRRQEHNAKAYDRITLLVPKGSKEQIAEAARAKGQSVNSYITSLIRADIPEPFSTHSHEREEKGR